MTSEAVDSSKDVSIRACAALLGILLLVGAWLRVYHYRGFDHSDEMEYLRAASDLVSGDYRFPSVGHGTHAWLRYTIVLPLAVHIKIYGPDDRACAAPFLLLSLAAIVVGYLLGRDLCRSRAAGLVFALFMALNPKDVLWATRYYPDSVQSLFLMLSFWLLVRSRGNASANPHATDVPVASAASAKGTCILAGLCLALALNSNLMSVLFFPIPVLVLFLMHEPRRALRLIGWFAVGGCLVYVPLMIFYWIATGTSLFEVNAVGNTVTPRGAASDPGGYYGSFLSRGLSRFWKEIGTAGFYGVARLITGDPGYMVLGWMAVAGMLIGVVSLVARRGGNRPFVLAFIWFGVLYLLFEFGSPFLPLRKVPRYLHLFIAPMIALFTTLIAPRLLGRAAAWGVTMGLILAAAYYACAGAWPGAATLPARYPFMTAVGITVASLVLILAARRAAPQAVGIGLLTLVLAASTHALGVGTYPHTQLGRAMRKMNPPEPVYTNCWRTRLLLQCLFLHDRGPEGVITLCTTAEIVEALDNGKAVVLSGNTANQYGLCSLPEDETRRLLPILDTDPTLEKSFDNGLYRVYLRNAEVPVTNRGK